MWSPLLPLPLSGRWGGARAPDGRIDGRRLRRPCHWRVDDPARIQQWEVTIYTGTDDDAEDERLDLQVIKDSQTFTPSSDVPPTGGKNRVFMVEDSHTQGYVLTAVPSKIYESGNFTTVSTLHFTPNYVREDVPVYVTLTANHDAYSALFTGTIRRLYSCHWAAEVSRPSSSSFLRGGILLIRVRVSATATGKTTRLSSSNGRWRSCRRDDGHVVDVHKLPKITVTAMTEDGAGPLMELAEGSKYKVKVEANRNQPSGEVTSETSLLVWSLATIARPSQRTTGLRRLP